MRELNQVKFLVRLIAESYARRLSNPKLTEQIRTRCQPFGLLGGYVYSLLLLKSKMRFGSRQILPYGIGTPTVGKECQRSLY